MTTIIHGIFKEGKIELLEKPIGVHEGNVRVILLAEGASPSSPRYLQFGKYHRGNLSTLEDFAIAEWREKPGWGESNGE